jgi:hypothetical protein
MTKFKLMALTLVIGTASLFVGRIDVAVEPNLDAEYEAEALENEAYEDADFFKKLEKENETYLVDMKGLKAFDKHLYDNYKKFLEEDTPILEISLKEKQSDQVYNHCGFVDVKGERDKSYTTAL